MKFGGSCLDRPSDIRQLVEIVKAAQANQPKLVLSAFRGVTDELIKQAMSARNRSYDLDGVERKHRSILTGLPSDVKAKTENHIEGLLSDLRRILDDVSAKGEVTAVTLDQIVSYGERFAIQTVSGYLTAEHLDNAPLSDIDAGLTTDSRFGDATLLEESYQLVQSKLKKTELPVIAGFFGKDKMGRIATLGRGGTDYVATFIASALHCDCVLFKDVEGVMSADPKIVANPKLLAELDYSTAMELAHYGSKVIFEKAITPAMKDRTAIRITSFLTDGNGTVIKATAAKATAISLLKNVTILSLPSRDFHIALPLKHELEKTHADDLLMTNDTDRETMIAILDAKVDSVTSIARKSIGDKVSTMTGRALIAMTGTSIHPVAAQSILSREGIGVDMISPSSSGRSVCLTLSATSAEDAVRILHRNLVT
jgi:aspartate kinase